MKIIPIFAHPNDNSEGLHAIKYDDQDFDEFERNFGQWNDLTYLLDYCKENSTQILSGYYNVGNLEEFIEAVLDEAYEFENMIYEFMLAGFENGKNQLQQIFKPLNNNESNLPLLQTTKAVIRNKQISKPKLRLYALRVGENCFIITGGAIKITHYMQDNLLTDLELTKMVTVKNFLISNEIYSQYQLGDYYYEQ